MGSNEMTPEEARRVLQEEQQKRLEEFQAELDALLKKYNVTLQVQQNIVVIPNAA